MDTVGCAMYLSRPVELEKQTCLTGKQVLPEIELCHAIATHHTAACLTPGGLQDLSHVITICLATCNMGSQSQTDSASRRLTCITVQSGRQAEHSSHACTKPLYTLFVQLFCEAVCIFTGPFGLICLSHKDDPVSPVKYQLTRLQSASNKLYRRAHQIACPLSCLLA